MKFLYEKRICCRGNNATNHAVAAILAFVGITETGNSTRKGDKQQRNRRHNASLQRGRSVSLQKTKQDLC
jgi:hypothetical protein